MLVRTCACMHACMHARMWPCRSHLVMELLPPLFNTLQQSKGEINRSNIQLLANPRNAAHRKIWNDNLHWIAAYLSVLSDSPLVFWNDLQNWQLTTGIKYVFAIFLSGQTTVSLQVHTKVVRFSIHIACPHPGLTTSAHSTVCLVEHLTGNHVSAILTVWALCYFCSEFMYEESKIWTS